MIIEARTTGQVAEAEVLADLLTKLLYANYTWFEDDPCHADLIRRLRETAPPERIVRAFGRRVREQRERRGWGLAELAKSTGLPEAALDDLERGERDVSLGEIRRVALAFQMSEPQLLDGLETPLEPGGRDRRVANRAAADIAGPSLTNGQVREANALHVTRTVAKS
jgi:transcriptional regulator with XRE-family HTH domain